jgi:hypothetical protein
MNILDKYKTISFKDNGYPADAFLRRVVYLVWQGNSLLDHTFQSGNLHDWEFSCANMFQRSLSKEMRVKTEWEATRQIGKRLVQGLIDAGTLVQDKNGHGLIFSGNRLPPDTAEARTANFSGALKKLSEKTVKSPVAREKLLQFLVDARNLYGFHFAETSEGRAAMFPNEFIFDEQGFRLNGVTAFISTKRGLEVWDISGSESFEVYMEQGRPKFKVSLDLATRNEVKTADFKSTILMPHAGQTDHIKTIHDVSKEMIASVKCLAGKRELLSEIVGEDIETAKWLGFVQSFYRVRSFFPSIRGVVFSILDVDVRKRAGRARKANYKHYNWFFEGNPEIMERKLQASDAFPVLTGEFLSEPFNSTINLGQPLLPVIAEQFSLNIPQARQLKGLHWQRLGSAIHHYDEFFKKDNRMFMGVPPEKMPKTKKDWKQAISWSQLYEGNTLSALSDDMIARLNRNLTDNLDKIPEHSKLDFDSVMTDIATALAPFVTGEYSPQYKSMARDRATFFAVIMGGNFGIKRLRALSEDWHRLAPMRTGAIRLMLRKVHNIPLAVWEPLTENFECEHGSLTWLTNEGSLISEGLRMRHCVGSYIDRCVDGVANIATICSADGDCSTVEIRLDGENSKKGKHRVIQHRTYKNENPSTKCDQVLAAYLHAYRDKELVSLGGTAGEQPPTMKAPLCETMRQSLIEAYKDCVPGKIFSMSRGDWAEAYSLYSRGKEFLLPEPKMTAYQAF